MHQYLATGDYYTTVLYRSFHELVPGCPLFLLEKRDETGPGWSQCGLAPDENNVVGIRKNKTKKGCSHTPYWSLRYDDRAATCMLHVWSIRTRYVDLRDMHAGAGTNVRRIMVQSRLLWFRFTIVIKERSCCVANAPGIARVRNIQTRFDFNGTGNDHQDLPFLILYEMPIYEPSNRTREHGRGDFVTVINHILWPLTGLPTDAKCRRRHCSKVR